jgi:hypothetical protein
MLFLGIIKISGNDPALTTYETRKMNNSIQIHIDRQPYQAHEHIAGESLYKLGKVAPGYQLFRETNGNEEDEPIADSQIEVKLTAEEHFYSTPRLFHIYVNTHKKVIKKDFITFEEVVALDYAPEPVPQGPNWAFTVAYRRGPHNKPQGTLRAGESVHIKDGESFHVKATDRS